ncbi:MAG: leucine--tRNA ligase [Candidatus Nanoarchaeia archaeon]|jgi:leucyl-tRNA synthetase
MEINEIEKKWQNIWKERKAFEPIIDDKKEKFFFTVPFPYTSGPLHVGHGRTYCIADFVARFKRKQGFNVLWPMAFHISGTPILAISDRIKKGDTKYIKLFKSYVEIYEDNKSEVDKIIESFKEPINVANYFASVISNDFDSIGLSIDWTRKFSTGDKEYNKFIEWQYDKFMESKVLVKNKHPVIFCLECNNAVGEDDVKDGDTDKVKINEFSAIKFKLNDSFIVASTLRPETIFGITNLWINPAESYAKIKSGKEFFIMSSLAYEKFKYQHGNAEKIEEFKGEKLVGKKVTTPIGSEVMVLPASFVDPDTASGVVYSVPAHAPFDYMALLSLQNDEALMKKYHLNASEIRKIKPAKIIEIKGYAKDSAAQAVEALRIKSIDQKDLLEEATKNVYKDEFYQGILNNACGEFSGKKISEIKDSVYKYLEGKKLAFKFYETTRKAECRCNGKVIVAVLKDQWFLDYRSEEWKNQTRELIKSMKIYPEKYRKMFFDVIDWIEMRPCARKRGLGTKLPYDTNWVIESLSDSTIYMAFYLLKNIIEKEKITPEQLTKEFFDYVLLKKGDAEKVSRSTKISQKIMNELVKSFEYWYPIDQRHTNPGHISNHLIFFIMHHIKIFPKKYWPKAMTFNEYLTGREGVKMSKSRGNVIPLIDISRKYSADLYRLYVVSSTEIDSQADWKDAEVERTKNKIEYFQKIMESAVISKSAKKASELGSWMLSRFYSRLKEAYLQGDKMQLRDYSLNMFFELLNEVSYFKSKVDDLEFGSVMKMIAADWLIALEPIMPHVCEEYYSRLSNKLVSLQLFPKIQEELINKSVENSQKTVINTSKDIHELLSIIKKSPKRIKIFIPDEWKYELFKEIINSGKNLDIKKILSNPEIKKHAEQASKIIISMQKNPSKRPEELSSRKNEHDALLNSSKFIEKEFNCKVEIVARSADDKAKSALPGKPGILIE